MKTWEYLILRIEQLNLARTDELAALQEAGQLGWELVSFYVDAASTPDPYSVYHLKRELRG